MIYPHNIVARWKIVAETHFPKHFTVKVAFELFINGDEFRAIVWNYFLDGYENAIILN
jgi:hypothetical protein